MKKYNFYAGPAILPDVVMKKAKDEFLNFRGIELSVIEISHRSKEFDVLINEAKEKILKLMNLGDDYSVLFLQGGASQQFGMIPLNFLKGGSADYVNTGAWAKKAIKEAKLIGSVNIPASSEDKDFTYIPKNINYSENPEYIHITSNETIGGVQYKEFPDTGKTPLICDMSSDIMSRELDYKKFSMIYAGAQKNIGPSGVTLVIIKKDLVKKCADNITSMLSYKTHFDKDSLYNTPPSFGIYIINLVLDWLNSKGGLKGIEKINEEKASLLYNILDESDFYKGTAAAEDRSLMNVTFRLPSEDLEKRFIEESVKEGFVGLKGHRSVGGCRASIYNAMPMESVKVLAEFMKEFERKS